MIVSAALTILLLMMWMGGFIFGAAAIGGLMHLLLILAFVTGFAFIIGAILFLVSVIQKD